MNVLIVEDDPEWRDILSEAVEAAGFTPCVSATEDGAFRLVEREVFPIALLDLALTRDSGDHGGLRVLEHIRRLGDGTRAVILTAHGDIELGASVKEQYDVVTAWAKKTFDPVRTVELLKTQAKLWSAPYPDFLTVADVLRCGQDVIVWEAGIRGITDRSVGDAGKVRELIRNTAAKAWPLVPEPGERLQAHEGDDCAAALYWSRGWGSAVLLVIGDPDAISRASSEPIRREVELGLTRTVVRHQRGKGLEALLIGVESDSHPRSSFSAS